MRILIVDDDRRLHQLLATYLQHRDTPKETFLEFTGRHQIDALKALCGETAP